MGKYILICLKNMATYLEEHIISIVVDIERRQVVVII